MRAAIYARYSSDLQSEASIDDQVRICRERAEREGMTVVEIYNDYAISGGSLSNRPGMLSVLDAAKSGTFDVLFAEALDRLSRDQEDIAAIYKRLRHYDVSILTIAEGHIDELHIGLKGTMNALFLKDLALRIRRGQRGRIEAGFSAGGISYGYNVVRKLDEDGSLVRGQRVINEIHAAMIQRIYAEYADGKSPRKIAADLNVEGVPAPRGGQWNASTINGHRARRNGILQNELYRGKVIYNRVRMVNDPDTGKRISRMNPESEWVIIEAPELRIVPDGLWQKVQLIKARYARQPAHKSRRPKRLLSGLLTCGECGGSYTIVRPGKYGCATHREKGTCANGRQISADILEHRVLSGIEERLSHPDMLMEFVSEFYRELARLRAVSEKEDAGVKRTVHQLNQRIDRIVIAIAEGTDTPALRQALLRLESEKAQTERKMKATSRAYNIKPPSNPEKIYTNKIKNLQSTLNAKLEIKNEAIPIFRNLIDRIILHPGQGRGKMSIEIFGEPSAFFLLGHECRNAADDRMIKVVAGEGLEPPTRGL